MRYAELDRLFWQDIYDRRLHVRDVTQRDVLRARHLLRYAGVQKGRQIKSADALIAASCLEFALETGGDVSFCLEDWKLYHVVRDIEAFKSVLRFKYIGIDKSMAAKHA
jgi:hypothetical protein